MNMHHRTKYEKATPVIFLVDEEDRTMTIVSGPHKGRRAACAAAENLEPGRYAVGYITDEISVIEPPKGTPLIEGDECGS